MSSPGGSSQGSLRDRQRGGSFTGSMHGKQTEDARLEHITIECIAKAVNIVLAARLNTASRSSQSVRDRCNRWFNLETEEVESAALYLEKWKREVTSPLFIEIYGEKNQGDSSISSSPPSFSCPAKSSSLLEVWTLRVARKRGSAVTQSRPHLDFSLSSSATSSGSGSGSTMSERSQASSSQRMGSSRHLDTPLIYKRAVILLRSLYCFVRLMPMFSIFQVTKRSSSCKLSITSKLKIGEALSQASFQSQLSNTQTFNPIETPLGNICISVSYASDPVDMLSKEYGSSVIYTAPKPPLSGGGLHIKESSPIAAAVATGPGGLSYGSSPDSFAPHSAPQCMRRQSWSFSRSQMQKEAAGARSKFCEVMVLDEEKAVEETETGASSGLVRKNSSPMLIPNAMGRENSRGAMIPSNSVESDDSSGGQLASQLRVKLAVSPSANVSIPGHAFTAPTAASAQRQSRMRKGVASSPDECVVGFAAGHHSGAPHQPRKAPASLPISALHSGKMDLSSSRSQSLTYKPPLSTSTALSRSGEGSDAGSFKMLLSCSPQLPFASTPRQMSSASSLSYDFQASSVNSAGGIPSIKLVRRSSSFKNGSLGDMMDSCSPNAQDTFFDGGLPGASAAATTLPLSFHNRPRITFPNSNSGTYDEDDQDGLPFALESSHNSPGVEGSSSGGTGMDSSHVDAAIGAFVRTLQEAPPLRSTSSGPDQHQQPAGSNNCRTIASAMLELKQLKEAINTARLVAD